MVSLWGERVEEPHVFLSGLGFISEFAMEPPSLLHDWLLVLASTLSSPALPFLLLVHGLPSCPPILPPVVSPLIYLRSFNDT